MVSASLKKKITPISPISFHSFGNLKKVCKKCGRDRIGGICQATFATRQSCSVLHSAARHSIDAPLRPCNLPKSRMFTAQAVHLATLVEYANIDHEINKSKHVSSLTVV